MINWSGCALRVSPYSPLQSPYGIILSAVMDMTQFPAILKWLSQRPPLCTACIIKFFKKSRLEKIVFLSIIFAA